MLIKFKDTIFNTDFIIVSYFGRYPDGSASMSIKFSVPSGNSLDSGMTPDHDSLSFSGAEAEALWKLLSEQASEVTV